MAGQSFKSLQEQIAKLQIKARKLLTAESKNKDASIIRVMKLMKQLGISPADLRKIKADESSGDKKKRAKRSDKAPRKPVAPKYRDSVTGNTWSGRGKLPRWLVARESEGRKRDDFRIP